MFIFLTVTETVNGDGYRHENDQGRHKQRKIVDPQRLMNRFEHHFILFLENQHQEDQKSQGHKNEDIEAARVAAPRSPV